MHPAPLRAAPAATRSSTPQRAFAAVARTRSAPPTPRSIARCSTITSAKEKKRNFRALWIQRINAAVREHGLTYSRFISGLATAGIAIDRKVLSDLAIHEPAAFKALVDQASKA